MGLTVAVLAAGLVGCTGGGHDPKPDPAGTGGIGTVDTSGLSDFNAVPPGKLPPGWSADRAGGTVGVAAFPDPVDRSLNLTRTAAHGALAASARFDSLVGAVEVTARVWMDRVEGRFDVLTVSGSGGQAVAAVAVRDGQFIAAASGQSVLPAAARRWYGLRLLLRTDTRRYDVYVDGQRVVADAPFDSGATDVAGVSTAVAEGTMGKLDIDDVYAQRAPDPSVNYVVLDQFNDTPVDSPPAGYQVSPGGLFHVEATPSDADHSVRLRGTGGGDATATRVFDPQTGTVVAQANVRTDQVSGNRVALRLRSSVGRAVAAIRFVDGWLCYADGPATYRLTPAQPGQWYTVRLVVDVAARHWDVYVDGRRFTATGDTGQPWGFIDATAADVGRLDFTSGTGFGASLLVDNVMLYPVAVAAPPAPVIDVRQAPYGAVGDGATDSTAAIQRAIDSVPAGGSVLLTEGVYLSGTIKLKSDMTLWVDRTATLLGTWDDAGYPRLDAATSGTPPMGGPRRSLILSAGADNVRIDGGGTIDGNGTKPAWAIDGGGDDGTVRPNLMFLTNGHNISVRDLYIRNAAAWALVPADVDNLLIADVNINSNLYANRDGIDIVDSSSVLVERTAVWSDDDAICFKSYTGAVDGAVVRLSTVGHSERANGVKFGTESGGAFRNVLVEDVLVKDVNKSAITVTSVDGATVANITFRRVTIDDALRAIFVLLGQRSQATKPPGWVSGLHFEDITATDLAEPAVVTGQRTFDQTFRVYDVLVSNVQQSVAGGVQTVPGEPAEYAGAYPESTFLSKGTEPPAYGFFFRHVNGLTVRNASTVAGRQDARPAVGLSDVAQANVG